MYLDELFTCKHLKIKFVSKLYITTIVESCSLKFATKVALKVLIPFMFYYKLKAIKHLHKGRNNTLLCR